MKLLYITENINPVFYSQVVTVLNFLSKKKKFDEIILAIGLREPKSLKIVDGLDKKIKILTFKTYPMYPIFNTLTKDSLYNLFKTNKIDNQYILHTRIEFLGMLAYKAYFKINSKKPNLLIDIRGALIEEVEIYGKMHGILKFLKLINYKFGIKKVLQNSTFINTVSMELKKYIQHKYNIDSTKISIIPTIAGKEFQYNEKERDEIRSDLKVKSNEVLFVFSSGSTQLWQNNDEIVDKLTNQGYKVLMLTKKTYDNKNVISRFVPYNQVAKYLNAADIGIIIRENDIVNNVASPIKFSEYIATGLPIVSNDSVNCINDIVKNNPCGIIKELDNLNKKELINLLSLDRKEISDLGQSIFGISTIIEQYIDIYNKIENIKDNNE